jgi:maleate isomerase
MSTCNCAALAARPFGEKAILINYGTRGRIGMLLPSSNRLAEPQFQAMLPPGVSLHTTRLKLRSSSETELRAMAEHIEEAAELLADAGVDLLAFHCTAVCTMDPLLEESIRLRAATASRTPVTTTAEALVAALHQVGARKIIMLSPYVPRVDEKEAAFLAGFGFEIAGRAGLGKTDGESMSAISPDEWYQFAVSHRDENAEAYLISCTTVRAVDVIERLERDFARPVITSNTATLWHCLRRLAVCDRMDGFGTLLRDH